MAQLKTTTINGTLSLNAHSGISDVEQYLINLSSQITDLKTALTKKAGYPDYSSYKVIISPTKNETTYTITEDGFIVMSVYSGAATVAWYMQINGHDTCRLTEYGSGHEENKWVEGPFPVTKGDIIRVFGGVNLKPDNTLNTSGIIFFKARA